MLEVLVKNARLDGHEGSVAIGIVGETIHVLQPNLTDPAQVTLDANHQFVCAGFCETHLHLDKVCILDRCSVAKGSQKEAAAESKKAKQDFTEDDVVARASRVVEMAIKKSTMELRTFVETDPRAGLRSLAALRRVRAAYVHALDIELCAFAQEGLTQKMATYELLRQALQQSAPRLPTRPPCFPHPPRL